MLSLATQPGSHRFGSIFCFVTRVADQTQVSDHDGCAERAIAALRHDTTCQPLIYV